MFTMFEFKSNTRMLLSYMELIVMNWAERRVLPLLGRIWTLVSKLRIPLLLSLSITCLRRDSQTPWFKSNFKYIYIFFMKIKAKLEAQHRSRVLYFLKFIILSTQLIWPLVLSSQFSSALLCLQEQKAFTIIRTNFISTLNNNNKKRHLEKKYNVS